MLKQFTVDLKPCPFCGGKAVLEQYHYCVDMQFADDIDNYYCVCTKCGSKGKVITLRNAGYRPTYAEEHSNAQDKAIKAWNRRKTTKINKQGIIFIELLVVLLLFCLILLGMIFLLR